MNVDVATISAAVSSLKAAKDIAMSMLHLSNMTEVQGKVIDLQSAILDAQAKALDSQAQLISLGQQLAIVNGALAALRSHKEFVATLARHEGAYLAPNDPDPFCPRCIEANTTPVHLVKTSKMELRTWVWMCPECKMQLTWHKPILS